MFSFSATVQFEMTISSDILRNELLRHSTCQKLSECASGSETQKLTRKFLDCSEKEIAPGDFFSALLAEQNQGQISNFEQRFSTEAAAARVLRKGILKIAAVDDAQRGLQGCRKKALCL